MRKDKLISQTAKDSDYAVWEVHKIAKSLKKNMHIALLNGEKVTIRGFGTYSIEIKPTYVRRNPRTKKEIIIPEQKVLKFKHSPKFNFDTPDAKLGSDDE